MYAKKKGGVIVQFGRKEIFTDVMEITKENVISVLRQAMIDFMPNQSDCEFLLNYEAGLQSKTREKTYRKDIDCWCVDNIANEITEFKLGFNWGNPITLVQRGVNGFGTYHQLVKALRLPTAHHTKWLQLKEDEKPVVGAKYNQYIITYCAPSMANPGFTVIGQHNMSVTTHVFWVNQAVDTEFQAALTAAGLTAEVVNSVTTNEDTKIDTAVAATEAGVKTSTNAGKKYSVNHEQTLTDKDA